MTFLFSAQVVIFIDCNENIYASIAVSIMRYIPSECGPVVQEMLFTENIYA